MIKKILVVLAIVIASVTGYTMLGNAPEHSNCKKITSTESESGVTAQIYKCNDLGEYNGNRISGLWNTENNTVKITDYRKANTLVHELGHASGHKHKEGGVMMSNISNISFDCSVTVLEKEIIEEWSILEEDSLLGCKHVDTPVGPAY